MPTESDVYVKFGDDPGSVNDYGEPEPLIQGDCTDDMHYWWCELRSCGFNLSVEDHSKLEGDSGAEDSGTNSATKTKPKTKWEKVSLKKRVDWASTQLFLRCCEAGRRKIEKSKANDDNQEVTIKTVTVHVCKTVAGEKFPFVVIWYNGVRITDYKVDMSGPEPEETIEIEFDSYEFGYQPTDPDTGKKVGSLIKTGPIERDEDPTHDDEADSSVPGGGSTAAAAVAAATGGAAGAQLVGAGAGGNGSPGISTATEVTAGANYPGYSQGTGPGLLDR